MRVTTVQDIKKGYSRENEFQRKRKATLTQSGYIGFHSRHSPLLVIYNQF